MDLAMVPPVRLDRSAAVALMLGDTSASTDLLMELLGASTASARHPRGIVEDEPDAAPAIRAVAAAFATPDAQSAIVAGLARLRPTDGSLALSAAQDRDRGILDSWTSSERDVIERICGSPGWADAQIETAWIERDLRIELEDRGLPPATAQAGAFELTIHAAAALSPGLLLTRGLRTWDAERAGDDPAAPRTRALLERLASLLARSPLIIDVIFADRVLQALGAQTPDAGVVACYAEARSVFECASWWPAPSLWNRWQQAGVQGEADAFRSVSKVLVGA